MGPVRRRHCSRHLNGGGPNGGARSCLLPDCRVFTKISGLAMQCVAVGPTAQSLRAQADTERLHSMVRIVDDAADQDMH